MSNKPEDLVPACRERLHAFLAECEARLLPPVRVTHTLRTADEQLHLYAKGRERRDGVWVIVDKRQVVTNAPPGESPHNRGAAFDVCFDGHDPYPKDDALWSVLGQTGEGVGLEWGGRWKFMDRPHFQLKDWRAYPVVV